MFVVRSRTERILIESVMISSAGVMCLLLALVAESDRKNGRRRMPLTELARRYSMIVQEGGLVEGMVSHIDGSEKL